MHRQELKDRTLIRVKGLESESFLNNLLTCDIENLGHGEARLGALLAPQGKILFDFFVFRADDCFLFDISSTLAEAFTKRLIFYRLRAKVDIEPAEAACVFACWGEDMSTTGEFYADSRHPEMGYRIYANKVPEGMTGPSYTSRRIEIGMPEGGIDFDYGDAYPHETLMDQFGGVDFVKGCYVGQEVVSRMQHRGTAKKRIVKIHSNTGLLESSIPVTADGKPAGRTGSVEKKNGSCSAASGPGRKSRGTDCRRCCYHGRDTGLGEFHLAGGLLMPARSNRQAARAWQRMLSGRRLDLLEPSPLDVEIEDIAHGLARVARWNGQTHGEHAFSVAQHSINVWQAFRGLHPGATPDEEQMALLHDAPEYVIGDMISPFKAVLGGEYKNVEARLQRAIHQRYSLPAEASSRLKTVIKRADSICAYFEATGVGRFQPDRSSEFFWNTTRL